MKYLISIVIIASAIQSMGQNKYFTRTGHIHFLSDAKMEKIEAHHYQSTGLLNTAEGNIAIVVNIKGFEFEKALMEEHFNENYLESDKYPKATFEGKILNFDKLDLSSPAQAEAEGNLTIHGITRKVRTKVTIEKKGTDLISKTTFSVLLKDYNIAIPKMVESKVAETVKIFAEMNFQEKK